MTPRFSNAGKCFWFKRLAVLWMVLRYHPAGIMKNTVFLSFVIGKTYINDHWRLAERSVTNEWKSQKIRIRFHLSASIFKMNE